jgi:hypothetical protein
MDKMREVYTMSDAQMPEWKEICERYAAMIGATLLFVNETSCGVQCENGSFRHIYIDEVLESINH